MKLHTAVWFAAICLLFIGCSESQNENTAQPGEETPTDTGTDTTDTNDTQPDPVDPNAWHDDCPADE